MARILVTGAAGKLGGAAASELVKAGHSVTGLYRSRPGQAEGVEWVQGDILNSDSYAAALAGCDAVIHMAAELFDTQAMQAVNVDATRSLLAAASEAGVRYFGFTSTISVYGSPASRRVDENTPLVDPAKPMAEQYFAPDYMLDYARTKAEGEALAVNFGDRMRIDIYRPAVVIYDSEILEVCAFGKLGKAFFAGRCTQYVMLRDVAAAIRHLLERGLNEAPRAEAYNLADPVPPTYSDIMRQAVRATGDKGRGVAIGLPAELSMLKNFVKRRRIERRYPLGMLRISTEKLQAAGFRAPVGVQQALAEALGQLHEAEFEAA